MRYLIAIFEKVSMNLCILKLGILSFGRFSMVGFCVVPRMLVVMIVGGSTSHPIWVSIGCSEAYLLMFFVGGFHWQAIVIVH